MQIYGRTSGSILTLAERLRDCNVSLRWGGPQVAGAINGQVHLLNGLEQLQALQTAGLRTPILKTSWHTEHVVGSDIWLGRRLEHTQGFDICPSNLPRQRGHRPWMRSDFFTLYEPAVREWRFHILNGQSIARGCKVWAGQGPQPEQHPIIRSRRLGWHIIHDVDPPKGLRSLAKQAVAAVGYDLGAVDMLELAGGTGVVLEINARPALRDEYTLAAYEKAFRSL